MGYLEDCNCSPGYFNGEIDRDSLCGWLLRLLEYHKYAI